MNQKPLSKSEQRRAYYAEAEQLFERIKSHIKDSRTLSKFSELAFNEKNLNSVKSGIRQMKLYDEKIKRGETKITQKQIKVNPAKHIQHENNAKIEHRVERLRKAKDRHALGGSFKEVVMLPQNYSINKNVAYKIINDVHIFNTEVSRLLEGQVNHELERVRKENIKKGLRCFITIKSLLVKNIHETNIEETREHFFNSNVRDLNTSNNVKNFINDLGHQFLETITTSQHGSNWVFKEFMKFTIRYNIYNTSLGKSYIPLPKSIADKKAISNPKNNDDKCFLHCLWMSKATTKHEKDNYIKKCSDRIIEPQNIKYPISTNDIEQFEELNNIQINVFELKDYDDSKDVKDCVQQLYHSNKHRQNVVNLLLIRDENNDNYHYTLVNNISRLFSSKTRQHAKFICPHCFKHQQTQSRLDEHIIKCSNAETAEATKIDVVCECPVDGKNIMKFKNEGNKFIHPFHIIADFESTLISVNDDETKGTQKYQKHVPNSFGLKYCCAEKQFDKDVEYVNNSNSDEVCRLFIEKIEEYAMQSYKLMIKNKNNKIVSIEEKQKHDDINNCQECNCSFTDSNKKVLHHNHISGKYISTLCNECNLKFQYKPFIPVYLHNLKGYDSHLFIKSLYKYGQTNVDLSCIPNNEEKYISFSKMIKVDEFKSKKDNKIHSVLFEIRFLDTIAFMNSSIESLVDNLKKGNNTIDELRLAFPNTSRHFINDDEFMLMTQKGIYPYDYIDSYDKLFVNQLPPKSEFYSKLNDSNISDEDYQQAHKVWQSFKCKSFLDYHNLYLKSDVLLLADVWESFRNTCYKYYELDCVYYYTAPGFSFDAMLKKTKIELELFTDLDMYEFVESGIRGGLSQISTRHAVANHKYLSNYDKTKEDNYIIYLDANNLYGWAMSQYMPYANFKWSDKQFDYESIMQISKTADIGYMFEVDLHIPDDEKMHDYFNNYAPCPENISIKKSDLSEWQQENYNESKITKLCTSLKDKSKYVINYRHLQLVLSLGVELKKVHRVLQFNQKPFLAEYIELNTNLRKVAKNEFEKDFFKLMNNSVFGKTMENVRNRINFRLISTEDEAWRVKNLNQFTIFDESLVGVHIQKQKILLNKPVYLGQTILDDSKYLMYDFHYNFMLAKIPRNDIDLLFTDTDSLCYSIRKHDIYEIIKNNKKYFDLSEYPEEHELFDPTNKKVIGKFKDECSGKYITEFVGLRAKLYAFSVDNCNKKHLKCKGVKKSVAKKSLNIDKYREVLYSRKSINVSQNCIRSYQHQIYSETVNKTALSCRDDKVYICDNNINTLSFGHYKIDK